MKVALIHDFLKSNGGAEKVLKKLADLFPDAPIYTLLHDKESTKNIYPENRIKTSFIQDFPDWLKNRHKFLLPFFPIGVEKMDLSEFDLVISSSSAFAKGVITRSNTTHVCYCHTPMRYVWDSFYTYVKKQKVNFLIRPIMNLYLSYLRMWDKASAGRTDYFIANSENVANRIHKYYRRDSKVIYPPIDVNSFTVTGKHANFFLIVSRLEPYKNIESAITAFNMLPNRHLVIIGEGSDRARLEKIAGKNIQFLGRENDAVTKEYFENCRAFIATADNEDFGITPVEAMACGKPVLALRSGGYLESVIEGVTGEFYDKNCPKELMDGLIKLLEKEESYNHYKIRKHAENFSEENFENQLADFLDKIMK